MTGGSVDPSGEACPKARCGRWPFERNDLDEACRLATLAAETLQVAGYATGSDRLEDLRDRMEPWVGCPAVRALNELLRA